MDIKRTVLWVIFFMSAVMLYDNWQRDHGRPSMFFPSATQTAPAAAAGGASGTGATTTAGEVPAAAAGAAPSTTAPAAQAQLVKFSTDVYDGEIDTRGGTLAKLTLKKQGDGKQPTCTSRCSTTRPATRISHARACSAAISRTTTTSTRS